MHAMTITYAAEAIGIARAAAGAGVPAAISFTTETDGRLPRWHIFGRCGRRGGRRHRRFTLSTTGSTVRTPPTSHQPCPVDPIGAPPQSVRANASRKSHAELDESPTLDAGDPVELADDYLQLHAQHPSISILGGCCGTDATATFQAIADAFLPATGAR